ncbi:MAG: Cytochrome oxidase assembly [Watsoniomyces obsoletus]|nr:MAG: Cytochrome oxidase assembly [Watsoniomyces obsoletus]
MASPDPPPAPPTENNNDNNNNNNNDNFIEDDLDDLFNYEAAETADVFRAIDTNMDASSHPPPDSGTKRKRDDADGVDGLGIDEEIKIRTRVPVVKLDEDKLLSEKGIPRLRKLAKKQLRFKGKGHEFSDVANLLAFYQLWLDDLYPKARFKDGLEIIEKLGHSRRMQVMRREWIEGENVEAGGRHEGDSGAAVDQNTQ